MEKVNGTAADSATDGIVADELIPTSKESSLELPSWINSDYFKEILASDGKSEWKYISHDVRMANEKGENYASVLYRVKVIAENKENVAEELSYILKVNHTLEDGPTKEVMEIFNVFTKEVEMYKSVVPSIEQLLHKSGDFTQISPKCIKTSTSAPEQIVLEDLSKKGFKMASRHEGLNWDHVKLVIERLSKFHAASAVLQANNGPYRDILLQGMYNEKLKPMVEVFFNSNLTMLKEGIQQLPNGTRYIKRMDNYENECFEKSIEVTKCNPDGFNVLNHGDLWTNNLMFKYGDNDNVEDMLFIDLQMPVWGSPAIDLHYFIVSSTEKKLKTAEFDAIIQHYHEHLVKTLKQLGYKARIPTLLELQVDLLQRGFLGVMASISVLPVVLLKDCEDADINNMLDEGDTGMNFKRKLYLNPVYINMLDMLYDYYDKKGILQI
ncbi:uncharacterized protein LOC119081961 isoform X1 [Bradysia coprophila]|uniref:uncharacterized protein LOC119081961 isoform X1 n=1 Tax=Bradysia coprophila TaxID=38358 RepID=UPI00187DA142|nr:uncharacterized protein LOC119081961 isoform X1 [Bradysia coprophila]